jgi:hypothetical protein
MIQLFDYIKIVFSNDEKAWREIKDIDKSRNFFMLNRFMSIKFPVQAAALSHYKIDAPGVSDYWHRTMSNLFKSTPNWVYAKTKKKNEESKKIDLPSDEMIKWFCEKNEMSRAEFYQNVNFFGDAFLKEIKSLEKILKSQGIL